MDILIHDVIVDEVEVEWECEDCGELNMSPVDEDFAEQVECDDCGQGYELIPHTDNVHIEIFKQ